MIRKAVGVDGVSGGGVGGGDGDCPNRGGCQCGINSYKILAWVRGAASYVC